MSRYDECRIGLSATVQEQIQSGVVFNGVASIAGIGGSRRMWTADQCCAGAIIATSYRRSTDHVHQNHLICPSAARDHRPGDAAWLPLFQRASWYASSHHTLHSALATPGPAGQVRQNPPALCLLQ